MTIATGYTVLPGPLAGAVLAVARDAIVEILAGADPAEVRFGSTSARVNGILGRVPALGALFDHAPLLDAVGAIVGSPFRLSSFHARSVMPGAAAEVLHQDVVPHDKSWPLASFILMLDAFAVRNGATRFVPGSCSLARLLESQLRHHPEEVHACGEAGSLIVFDGTTWHGHAGNATNAWRHSVQGAFIPQAATPAVDFERSLSSEVWHGLSDRTRCLMRQPSPGRA